MRINAFFSSEVNLNQDLMLSEPQCQGVNLSKQGWVNLPERYREHVDRKNVNVFPVIKCKQLVVH